MRLERIANVADARKIAKRTIPGVLFDYIDGAADDEATMRANTVAFDEVVFRPRVGLDVREPDMTTTVLGAKLSMPLLLAPTGLAEVMHRDGAVGAARAAASRGTICVLSTVAGSPVEQVAPAAPGSVWFQLYAGGSRSEADKLLARAEAAGVSVLVVTMDTPTLGNRERDRRHGVTPPLRLDAHNAIHLGPQVLARPLWTYRMARHGVSTLRSAQDTPLLSAARSAVAGQWLKLSGRSVPDGPRTQGHGVLRMVSSPFTWADVEHLKARWSGKLVVKGVLRGDDARISVDLGADAVIISNHGGRQLDGAPATLSVLPEVADAVGDSAEVMLDGGVRRGTHVLKAVALGARAVFIGRPFLYGLATAGQLGVEHILDLFQSEITRDMILLGCQDLAELSPTWLRVPTR
ncbi:MAG: alpha-hydroxy acid oxidase [Actinomycetota bacterium]|jgi:isopentenyl diphosphate isomerase/L-lactate dehydrogenase-like FMN-dependent dehydrogenase|nr:alpha-hydroxy acid oxidase [Actinomycetota bacterium]